MDVIHIPARSSVSVKLTKSAFDKLPKIKFAVLTTVQHLHKIDDVAKQLSTKFVGQTLGCNVINPLFFKDKVDAFLFVGSGMFHPIYFAYKTDMPVFIWNPFTKILSEVSKDDVKKYEKRRKGALLKFLNAKNIGIIVSLKPGQFNLSLAEDLVSQIDKNAYVFLADTLDTNDLENFTFIDCWVNTSCPRLADDKVMVNIDELIEADVFKPKNKPKTIWSDKRGLEL